MNLTVRELREYILALKIVKEHKPLLALDVVNNKLQLYSEITELETLLENTLNSIPMPRRGQTKVYIEIPRELQTEPTNKAIRYGIPYATAISRSRKKEITLLDSCHGIAMANKLLPFGQNDFRLLTTEEERDLI